MKTKKMRRIMEKRSNPSVSPEVLKHFLDADGKRPWHHRFCVRDVGDGRKIAVWVGSYNGTGRGESAVELLGISR